MRRRLRSLAIVSALTADHQWPAIASCTTALHPGKKTYPHRLRERSAGRSWYRAVPDSPHSTRSPQCNLSASSAYSSPCVMPTLALRGGASGEGQGHASQSGQEHHHSTVDLTGFRRSAKICALFVMSYVCSIGFNINNKRALLLVPLPWTYAALNLAIGSAIALVSWTAKAAPWPRINWQDVGVLVPMGFLHAVSHLTVVLGLGAGAVSFLQTVKASEACFTALLSYLFLGQILPLPVYLTLLPVVIGVGITSCNQIRFSWMALLSALVSNLSNAMRNVLIVKNIGSAAARDTRTNNSNSRGKRGGTASAGGAHAAVSAAHVPSNTFVWNNTIRRRFGSASAVAETRAGSTVAPTRPMATAGGNGSRSGLVDLASGDTFRLLTVIGAVLILPAAALLEGTSWPRLWRGATDAGRILLSGASSLREESAVAARGDWAEAFRRALISGVCFNLFYDLTFRLLGQLHPVTHAVGNTVKRIVVIGAGAAAFGGDLGGARGAMGSALAVVGVLAYSIVKSRCKAQ